MVLPRFARLPVEQQQAITHAAVNEFAAHGFHDASLNRVIEAAGISKGSMYYYFDGKEDLYAYVVQVELEHWFREVGALALPVDLDADAFWSNLESYYLRAMESLTAAPQLAGLLRGWIAASGNPKLRQAQQQMEQAVLPWIEQTLVAGQRAHAVRTDLPPSLLIAVVLGMGQAMDFWLMTQNAEPADLPALIRTLVGMIRGALQPPAAKGRTATTAS